MKNLFAITTRPKAALRLALLAAALCALLASPLLSSAKSPQAASVTVVNESSNQIDNVFFATSAENWGPDQLNNGAIAPGSSASFDVSCSGSITVITEDGDGCFVYSPASCSGGTVTVSNSSARDCGN